MTRVIVIEVSKLRSAKINLFFRLCQPDDPPPPPRPLSTSSYYHPLHSNKELELSSNTSFASNIQTHVFLPNFCTSCYSLVSDLIWTPYLYKLKLNEIFLWTWVVRVKKWTAWKICVLHGTNLRAKGLFKLTIFATVVDRLFLSNCVWKFN